MMLRISSILFCCALFCGLSSAQAAPLTHDGFYMQLGVGLGFYHLSGDASVGALEFEETFKGLTIPTSLMLGGTIMKHLVIGGGFFLDIAPAPSYELNGEEPPVELDFKQFILGIGVLLDYYVWSNDGLHFPLFLGWGGVETAIEGNALGNDPVGFIMYFGGGYDFWISDNWSVGGLIRLVIAPLKINEVKYTAFEPGILATITFH